MKKRIRNSASWSGVLVYLSTLIFAPVLAHSQSFNFAPGGGPNGFNSTNVCTNSTSPAPGCQILINGSPNLPQILPSGALRLNTANLNQHASAWFYTPQPLSTGFTTAFQFQITTTGACHGCSFPADGIALVIQGDPAGTGALGYTGNGQNISYGDNDVSEVSGAGSAIANSLAVELDTYFNPDYSDPDGNHIAVQSCGPNSAGALISNSADHGFMCSSGQPAKVALQSLPSGSSLSDGKVHTITVNYLPPANGCTTGCNNLSIYFDSAPILQATINLTQQLYLTSTASNGAPATGAYIGFTSSTGGSVENNDILSWSYSQLPLSPITIPEPLQPTQTVFNYSPILSSSVDYSNSGLPASDFTGIVMQGTSQAITDLQFQDLTLNTPFQGATCLHQDLGGGTFSCVVTTDLCTTPTNSTPAGANCPGTQSALIGTTNNFNSDPSQVPFANPAYLMGKDNALTNCQAGDDNTCKGLLNIFVSITGDAAAVVGRTKDFNSILIPAEGIVSPSTTVTTTPPLNNGWTNGAVAVNFSSKEVVPPTNLNPPSPLPTISSVNYTISGANAPTPLVGSTTGATGSANVPGTVAGNTTVTYQAQDSSGTAETILTTTNGQAATSIPMLTIKVDLTPPVITPPVLSVTPPSLNIPATISFSCTDGGSGVVLCGPPGSSNIPPTANTGTLTVNANTSMVGPQSLTLNSQDQAGNPASTVFNYTVAAPSPQFSQSSVNFQNVYAGTAASESIQLTNSGAGALRINSVSLVPPSGNGYSVVSNCPQLLTAGSGCGIAIGFISNTLGTHSASVVIADTAANSPQTIPLTANVISKTLTGTSTALSSSLPVSAVGQQVTYTATVTAPSGGMPTGSVTFYNGTTSMGTVSLAGAQASLNKVFNAAGTHTITAVYSGDSNFATSKSPAVNQAVNKASTTTSLVPFPNPSTVGQSVTLTATVSPQYTGTPTGTVTFMNGTVTLGTVALSGGSATFNKTFVASGTRSLSAIYSGDSNFMTSTGTATQTIQ